MKTNTNFSGTGMLRTEFYQSWANYYLRLIRNLYFAIGVCHCKTKLDSARFLDAYFERGIRFWGLTAQNEPTNGYPGSHCTWNCMGWNATDQATWIAENLGPTLMVSWTRLPKISWASLNFKLDSNENTWLVSEFNSFWHWAHGPWWSTTICCRLEQVNRHDSHNEP